MPVSIPITAITASLLALLFTALSGHVIRLRRSLSVSVGTGSNATLERAIRAHGNFSEYTPIFLILLLIAELQSASGAWLTLVAIAFVLGRVAHGYAFVSTSRNIAARVGGMFITLTCVIILGLQNLLTAF